MADENGAARDDALAVLSKINDRATAVSEATQIQDSLALEQGAISQLFTTFRRPLLIGIMLAGFSQLSGITPLFSFLPEIFRSAGTATSDAFFQSVLVSLVNLVFTLLALWLVDLSGRRTHPNRHALTIRLVRSWSAGSITFMAAVWRCSSL